MAKTRIYYHIRSAEFVILRFNEENMDLQSIKKIQFSFRIKNSGDFLIPKDYTPIAIGAFGALNSSTPATKYNLPHLFDETLLLLMK